MYLIAYLKRLLQEKHSLRITDITIDYVPEKLQCFDEETKTFRSLKRYLSFKRTSLQTYYYFKIWYGKTAVIKNVVQRLHQKAKDLGIEVISFCENTNRNCRI